MDLSGNRIRVANDDDGKVRVIGLVCVNMDCHFEFRPDSESEIRGICRTAYHQLCCPDNSAHVTRAKLCGGVYLDTRRILRIRSDGPNRAFDLSKSKYISWKKDWTTIV